MIPRQQLRCAVHAFAVKVSKMGWAQARVAKLEMDDAMQWAFMVNGMAL